MDKKYWAAMECEDGYIYHDADIAANAKVQEIMIRAQANKTELGYWRDVATDLAALVDEYQSLLDALWSGTIQGIHVDAWANKSIVEDQRYVSTLTAWLQRVGEAMCKYETSTGYTGYG